MRYLYSMLVKLYIPVFLGAMAFFVLILQLVDLFQNLQHYLGKKTEILMILEISWLYLPKCIAQSIPMAFLFSIAFSLGILYSNNELIAVFGSGISLKKFVLPFFLLASALSIAGFYFDDLVVISTYRESNQLKAMALSEKQKTDNSNITILVDAARIVYHADVYRANDQSLSTVMVVERDDEGRFVQRMDAERAFWEKNVWRFENARIFTYDEDSEYLKEEFQKTYINPEYTEKPESFLEPKKDIEEMALEDAREWLDQLRKTGKVDKYREDFIDYLKRYSMTLTPLIVAFISCALGGKFKKNVLLMSLLASLVIIVLYFVFQMLTTYMAQKEMLSPMAGAWMPFIIFSFIGLVMFKKAKT